MNRFIPFFCFFFLISPVLAEETDPKAGRTLVWADEFDYPDAQLDENWNSQNGPSGHILCSRWRENASVKDGTLRLQNRKETRAGQDWTSASIWSKKRFMYGYFECRYRYAAATGTNNSFWFMTTSDLTRPDGQPVPKGAKRFEIDVNEGHFPGEVNMNVHNWSDVTVKNGKKTHPTSHQSWLPEGNPNLAEEFHTYGLLWTEKELVFYFDGQEIRRMPNKFCFSEAPIYLSEAIIRWAGEVTDAIDGTYMEVDYVRVYQ